jgi:YHS domain-containing protein
MRKLLAALAIAFSSLFIAAPAYADEAPVYTSLLSRVAVSGYDPVAYFTDGRPVRGSQQFSTTYQGYEYRFASAAHRDAFRAAPARYLPQYGGYCAWAVGQGYTASADPTNWRIVDGGSISTTTMRFSAAGSKTSPATFATPTPAGRTCLAAKRPRWRPCR